MHVITSLCWMKTLTKRQNFTFCSAIFASLLMLSPLAHAQNESGVNPLEMEQLQAQVDVMLEEMSELQGYRICGEQGFVFDPNSADADADGCVQPVQTQPTLEAPRIVGGELAPTAKTFKLSANPKGSKRGESIPLKSISGAATGSANTQSPGASLKTISMEMDRADPIQTTNGIDQDPAQMPRAVEAVPALEADYPSDRVRALVEMAVAQALKGAENPQGGVIQAPESTRNAPLADVKPTMGGKNAQTMPVQSAQGALIPSCSDGEFLTVMGGEVVCRRAAAAGKMACPPAVLRTYVDWHDQHIHFHIPYTPHGQVRTAQENSDIIKVECNNSVYKMVEITRNECGGGTCQEGRKPAYSMTYYCNQDKTKRCYAKQNGHLVNHTYTSSYINKQY